VPVRIVVHLLPSGPRSAVPPPHTGPAAYAAILAAVRTSDPTLATLIHERPRYKPLALSPLLDADNPTRNRRQRGKFRIRRKVVPAAAD